MSEFERGQPKRPENEPIPESVDLGVSETGEVTGAQDVGQEDTSVSIVPDPEHVSGPHEKTAIEGMPVPRRENTGVAFLGGKLPDLENVFGEKKPGLKMDELKALYDEIDGLVSVGGKLTIGDIKKLLPPETVRQMSRWQLHRTNSRLRKALQKRYRNRIYEAMETRGDVSELSEEERLAREERFSADTAKASEEYGFVELLEQATDFLEKESGEKF